MWLNLLCLVVLLIFRSPAQIGRFVCTLVFENLKCFILTSEPAIGSWESKAHCGEWRLASVVWSHRRTTLAQITEKVKAGSDRFQNEQCITAYCVATNLCQCRAQSSTNNIQYMLQRPHEHQNSTMELNVVADQVQPFRQTVFSVSRMMNPVRLQTRFRNRNMTMGSSCWLGVSVQCGVSDKQFADAPPHTHRT